MLLDREVRPHKQRVDGGMRDKYRIMNYVTV